MVRLELMEEVECGCEDKSFVSNILRASLSKETRASHVDKGFQDQKLL